MPLKSLIMPELNSAKNVTLCRKYAPYKSTYITYKPTYIAYKPTHITYKPTYKGAWYVVPPLSRQILFVDLGKGGVRFLFDPKSRETSRFKRVRYKSTVLYIVIMLQLYRHRYRYRSPVQNTADRYSCTRYWYVVGIPTGTEYCRSYIQYSCMISANSIPAAYRICTYKYYSYWYEYQYRTAVSTVGSMCTATVRTGDQVLIDEFLRCYLAFRSILQ